MLVLVKCVALEEFASPEVCVCTQGVDLHTGRCPGEDRGLLEQNVANSSSCARHGMAPRDDLEAGCEFGKLFSLPAAVMAHPSLLPASSPVPSS